MLTRGNWTFGSVSDFSFLLLEPDGRGVAVRRLGLLRKRAEQRTR